MISLSRKEILKTKQQSLLSFVFKKNISPELAYEETLEILDNDDQNTEIVEFSKTNKKKVKKDWNMRPENWKDIALSYKKNCLQTTLVDYEEELNHIPTKSKKRSIERWVKDLL